MISPFTPPGTHVVCIDDRTIEGFTRVPAGHIFRAGALIVRVGAIYVVREIVPDKSALSGYAVRLVGVRRHKDTPLALERFKPAVLPKALTELLDVVPSPADLEAVP